VSLVLTRTKPDTNTVDIPSSMLKENDELDHDMREGNTVRMLGRGPSQTALVNRASNSH
jgi:hypothetical protein